METLAIKPVEVSAPFKGVFNLTELTSLNLSGFSVETARFMGYVPFLSLSFKTDSETNPIYEIGGDEKVFGEKLFEEMREIVISSPDYKAFVEKAGGFEDAHIGINGYSNEMYGVPYICTENVVSPVDVPQLPKGVFSNTSGVQMKLVSANVIEYRQTPQVMVKLLSEGTLLRDLAKLIVRKLGSAFLFEK